ncbi:MAG: PilZ domain-containing protein [Candidatus Omnitrophica bacterium]|nr:PilZ domain-containing protein [Candidatus Omnitrophota bacterium]
MEKGIEKRRYPRVDVHIPVKYYKLGNPAESGKTSVLTKNLSEGGIRFEAPEFISRACRLILELDMPMFTKSIKAISKVAWIKKGTAAEDYDIGNKFLEISKEDKELVSQYVSSLSLYNDAGENRRKPGIGSGDID